VEAHFHANIAYSRMRGNLDPDTDDTIGNTVASSTLAVTIR
jgi:hypothetical protein